MFLADLPAEKKLLGDGLHLDTFDHGDHRIFKWPEKVCLNLAAEAFSDILQRKKLLVDGTNSAPEALTDIPQKKSFLKVGTYLGAQAFSDILHGERLLKVGTTPAPQAFQDHRIINKPSLEGTNLQKPPASPRKPPKYRQKPPASPR